MEKLEKTITRRSFFLILAKSLFYIVGLLVGYILLRFFSYTPLHPAPKRIDIGTDANYPPQGETILENNHVALIHQAGKPLQALSLKCTHLGCLVKKQGNEWVCPCHGSRYTFTGKVIRGPAASALQELEIKRDGNGSLFILLEE
jgi:Rieske Fe-S protein